jgi:hypothetical protein
MQEGGVSAVDQSTHTGRCSAPDHSGPHPVRGEVGGWAGCKRGEPVRPKVEQTKRTHGANPSSQKVTYTSVRFPRRTAVATANHTPAQRPG